MQYEEPLLTYLVLDFRKEEESRRCLESIKEHTIFSHKVIYLHNGDGVSYPERFLEERLIDQLIHTRHNTGLGIGTRDLFAACFSPYAFYLQNDQYLKRDFLPEERDYMISLIGQQLQSPHDSTIWTVQSVDLAGGMWGLHGYSERAHIIPTAFYKQMEALGMLGHHGAGPYHEGPWREEQIQKFYKANHFLHYTYPEPLAFDNGHRAVRQNADGSVWEHKTGTDELRLISGPIKQRAEYPPFTEEEWNEVLKTQNWPEWKIPEKRRSKES